MVLLAGKAVQVVESVLGGGVDPAIGTLLAVNDAGQWLTSSRPWNYLRGGMEALDLVEGQDWVALPENFGAILSVEQTASYTNTFEFVTLDALLEHRAAGVAPSGATLMAALTYDHADIVGTSSSPSATVTPTTDAEKRAAKSPIARLELYPTPDADSEGALICFYRRGWVNVYEDTDTIFVPPWLDNVLIRASILFAKGYEEEDFIQLEDALTKFALGRQMASAIRMDNGQQRVLGRVRGGAARGRPYFHRSRGTVSGPS